MNAFEHLIEAHKTTVERYVRYRIPEREDAEDVLQNVYLNAFRAFGNLSDRTQFKPWLISIARNCVNDWFRAKARRLEIPTETLEEEALSYTLHGLDTTDVVTDTLERLGDRDKQILYLYYWDQLPQADIAARLRLPLGTVKSRLHTARARFKAAYPYADRYERNGEMTHGRNENIMNDNLIHGAQSAFTTMPMIMPEYTIKPRTDAPFETRCEELMGWFIVPRPGERLSWGLYDMPSRRCAEYHDMEAIGRAEIHGIEGVEIVSHAHIMSDESANGAKGENEWRFIAQRTDTHTRYLAETHVERGVRRSHTFLDGDEFMKNWGIGPDNCGREILLRRSGAIRIDGEEFISDRTTQVMDVVGRYDVTVGGSTYDTICLMDIEQYDEGCVSQQYIDRNGCTVLWRRFNPDDWRIGRYGSPWSDRLPDNERIIVNGKTCIHWYDCLTSYVLADNH